MPTINIRLSDDDLAAIDTAAAARGLSRSAWIRLAAMDRPAGKMTFPAIEVDEALIVEDPIDPKTFRPPRAKTQPSKAPEVAPPGLSKAHFARKAKKK